jgi:hypothetical protein
MKDNTFAVYVLATPRARNDERTDRVGSQSRWYGRGAVTPEPALMPNSERLGPSLLR